MTDAELRDAAVAELKQTTVGWSKVKTYSPEKLAGTHWGKAMDYLAQIGQAPPPPRPPPPPPPTGDPTGYFWRGDFRSGTQDFSGYDMHDTHPNSTFQDWAVGSTKDVVVVPKPAGSKYPWSNYMARITCTNSLPSNSASGQTVNLWQPGAYGHPWTRGNTVWCRTIIVLPDGTDPRYPGKVKPVQGDGVSSPFHVLVEWHKNDGAGAPGPTSSKLEIGWGNAGPCLMFHPFGTGSSTWLFETNQVQTTANGVGGSTGPIGGTFIPLKFNHEYDLLWRWRLDPDPTVGEIDWYVDGNLRAQLRRSNMFQKSDGSVPGLSFQAGMYRNYPTYLGNVTQTTNENEHVYIVAMVAGPTRASVGA